MTQTSFILYRSETDMAPRSDAARTLLSQARRENAARGLTGFLHHEEGFFFQWLEGDAAPLAEITVLIERDTRHRDMTYLSRGEQDERKFADWAMGYSVRSGDSILSWLADPPVAQRDTLAYAASVLSFLRQRRAEQG